MRQSPTCVKYRREACVFSQRRRKAIVFSCWHRRKASVRARPGVLYWRSPSVGANREELRLSVGDSRMNPRDRVSDLLLLSVLRGLMLVFRGANGLWGSAVRYPPSTQNGLYRAHSTVSVERRYAYLCATRFAIELSSCRRTRTKAVAAASFVVSTIGRYEV